MMIFKPNNKSEYNKLLEQPSEVNNLKQYEIYCDKLIQYDLNGDFKKRRY